MTTVPTSTRDIDLPDEPDPVALGGRMTADLDRVRSLLAELPEVEWEALTDPGDRKTAPAWIIDAGEIEVRLPATYQAGRLAAFIAEAPMAVTHLLARLDAVRGVHAPVRAVMNAGRREQLVQVCAGCGTDDGNWMRWPCPTIKALEGN